MRASRIIPAFVLINGAVLFWCLNAYVSANQKDDEKAKGSANLIGLSASSGDLIAFTVGRDNRFVIVNSKSMSIAAYQLSETKGEIELTSARKIDGDLKIDVWNGRDPLPAAIRSLIGTE